jgi:plasmid stability protein
MAMTLRLSDEEHAALKARAEADGISMQEAVRRALGAYLDQRDHRERVLEAARAGLKLHGDALERLGR